MIRFALLLSLLAIGACADHKSAGAAATASASMASGTAQAAAQKSMSQRFNGPPLKQNSNGEWPDDVSKFSASDSNRVSPYFNEKSTIAKPYKTGQYAKTEWTGKQNAIPKTAYTGSTDGNRFHTASRIQHDDAHESGNAAVTLPGNYKTGSYKTSSAHEAGAKTLDKPANAQVEDRRRVYPEPEVSSWKQQRALDMKTTKGFLGHDE